MRSRAPRGAAGLSLVELVIGLAIASLMAAAVASAVFTSLEAAALQRDDDALTQGAQRALARMAEFVRETDEVIIPTEAAPVGDRLVVRDRLLGSGEEVEFYLEASEGRIYEEGQLGGVLIEEVSQFVVRRTASAGSQPLIALELGLSRGGRSVLLTTTVVPRNNPDLFPDPPPDDGSDSDAGEDD